jgi:hypothetical protein
MEETKRKQLHQHQHHQHYYGQEELAQHEKENQENHYLLDEEDLANFQGLYFLFLFLLSLVASCHLGDDINHQEDRKKLTPVKVKILTYRQMIEERIKQK